MASFTGDSGNNSFVAAPGNNSYDGLGGTDSLNFTPRGFEDATLAKTGALAGTITIGTDVSTFSNMENFIFLDGRLTIDIGDRVAQVYRMYDTVMNRNADFVGRENWSDALSNGMSLRTLAETFYNSAEGQARFAGTDNATFVTRLYTDVLDRSASAGEIQGWVNALNGGVTRAEVLVGFSESTEHVTSTAGGVQAGLWDQDLNALRVSIAYHTALGRAPEEAGMAAGLTFLALPNTSFRDLINAFSISPEFRDHHSGQSNAQYVNALYLEGLGRNPAGNEAQGWITALDSGAQSRADVLFGIANSQESFIHAYAQADHGIMFA